MQARRLRPPRQVPVASRVGARLGLGWGLLAEAVLSCC